MNFFGLIFTFKQEKLIFSLMETSKLHAFGKEDHFNILKGKYKSLKSFILGNVNLSKAEKDVELKNLENIFAKEKEESYKKNY